jgi:hypothetical protein
MEKNGAILLALFMFLNTASASTDFESSSWCLVVTSVLFVAKTLFRGANLTMLWFTWDGKLRSDFRKP